MAEKRKRDRGIIESILMYGQQSIPLQPMGSPGGIHDLGNDHNKKNQSPLNKLMGMMRDPSLISAWAKENWLHLRLWMGFGVFSFIIFYFFSDWDFSLLLTFSALVAMFSFLMVVAKIETTKSCRGVSLKMFECYLVVTISRLISIIPYEGYLPFDRSGDWLYQTIEAVSLVLIGSIIYMCRVRHAATYDQQADSSMNHIFLIVGTFVLALIFHPGLNSFMPADVAWTFALYLEALSVLPQLLMFQREGRVEEFTTHFLAGQALARALSFIFWLSSYKELNDPNKMLKSHVGYWVLLMQLAQLLVMADFIWQYIKAIARGVSVSEMIFAEDV